MQYRIVKRKDYLNEKEYYCLERRNTCLNNWQEAGIRCISLETMQKQLECYINEKEVMRTP